MARERAERAVASSGLAPAGAPERPRPPHLLHLLPQHARDLRRVPVAAEHPARRVGLPRLAAEPGDGAAVRRGARRHGAHRPALGSHRRAQGARRGVRDDRRRRPRARGRGFSDSVPLIVFSFALSQLGQRSVQGVFWAIPPMFLGGTAAAAGIALINSVGNLGGFVGPTVMGWLRGVSGSYSAGLLVLAAALVFEAVLVMTLRLPKRARTSSEVARRRRLTSRRSVCHASSRAHAHMAVSLADEAYLAIRDEILRGQLRPGTPLSRRRLARAARHERAAGQRRAEAARGGRPGREPPAPGTRVKVPTRADVRELYELREALETQAARLFAERATPAQRRELRRLAEAVDALFEPAGDGGEDDAVPLRASTASTCSSTCGSPSTPAASCSSR